MHELIAIVVLMNFSWAVRGIHILEFVAGETALVDPECAEVAVREGWAKLAAEERQDDTPAPEPAGPETPDAVTDGQAVDPPRVESGQTPPKADAVVAPVIDPLQVDSAASQQAEDSSAAEPAATGRKSTRKAAGSGE